MAQLVANIYMAQSTGTVNDITGTVNDVTGTVNDVTGTVNWHSKSSHKLTGTVDDIVGTVNEEYKGKYRNTNTNTKYRILLLNIEYTGCKLVCNIILLSRQVLRCRLQWVAEMKFLY